MNAIVTFALRQRVLMVVILVMMLAAGIGSSIDVSCSGSQMAEAMAAISALVEGKFGED